MATQYTNTPFDGQQSSQALSDLLTNGREARIARRAKFLADNPTHFACAVAGCEGLVSPDYTRGYDATGKPWGLCPRSGIHSLIDPRNFPPRNQRNGRRSLPTEFAEENRMDADEPEAPEAPAKPRSAKKEPATA